MINDYKEIQLVNGETTSKNFDKRPFGFPVWRVANQRPFEHDLVSLASEQPSLGADLHQGLVYSTTDVNLAMDLWVPRQADKPVPCVIIIQGGGFMASDGQMVRPLATGLELSLSSEKHWQSTNSSRWRRHGRQVAVCA